MSMRGVRFMLLVVAASLAATGCASGKGSGVARPLPPSKHAEAGPLDSHVAQLGDWVLLPAPRTVQIEKAAALGALPEGEVALAANGLSDREYSTLLTLLRGAAGSLAIPATAPGQSPRYPQTNAAIDPTGIPQPQGYDLNIDQNGIQLRGHDGAGLFYGAMTVVQLARQAQTRKEIPLARIVDWPDFPHRGVMLDVARDKVPTMETLYALVDMMAEWKFNQLQLYTEHTFAYRNHPLVWQDASPMTQHQIRALDAYCKDRFIELAPNQNSFGHMNRWLQFDAYKHLGEMPGGGSDLCPTDPDCVAFLADLYGDLLPNFSSTQVNVGCDETASIGKGRSKQAVKARGEGRVYLDFLMQIHELAKQQGKTMQFWGDIIMNHKELIPELPKDVTAMEWGYEAKHPFAAHGKVFARAGVPFYVVPGTSSWNSLAGRTDNALENLRNAAVNGLANGAVGYLITDWGDGGHWQFLPVSYLGFAYGAGVSWCVETNADADIVRAVNVHAFYDAAGVMGKLAYDLGNAYQRSGVILGNNTFFYSLLQHVVEQPLAKNHLKSLTAQSLQDTLAYIDQVMVPLAQARMNRPDAPLIRDEFVLTADLMRVACHIGLARVQAGGVATSVLPKESRHALAAELEPLLPQFRQLWLARNRSGGLKDSVGRMESLLATLKAE